MVSEEASAQRHADFGHSRRCLRPLRGDRPVGIVESNGVVVDLVELAGSKPLEPDYNAGKLRDLERPVSGTYRGKKPCSVIRR
jgi:hypothetical protein